MQEEEKGAVEGWRIDGAVSTRDNSNDPAASKRTGRDKR